MNELEQAHDEILGRITWSVAIIGVILGVITVVTNGLTSPWFFRALALLVIAGITFGVRSSGRVLTASYLLVIQLVGFVAELSLQSDALLSFVPYLFIPVAVIAAVLLTPSAALAIVGLSLIIVLVVTILTKQLTAASWFLLVPPFALTILSVWLNSENYRHLIKLGKRLNENRTILSNRTREMMKTARQVEQLEHEIETLKARLNQVKQQSGQVPSVITKQNSRLHQIIEDATRELNNQLKEFERHLEYAAQEQYPSKSLTVDELRKKLDGLRKLAISLGAVAGVEVKEPEFEYQPTPVRAQVEPSAKLPTANKKRSISPTGRATPLFQQHLYGKPAQNKETALISAPVVRSSTPVSRMVPVYGRRFGIILLGGLMFVAGLVGVLAMINGPVNTEAPSLAAEAQSSSGELPTVSLTPSPTAVQGRTGFSDEPEIEAELTQSPSPQPSPRGSFASPPPATEGRIEGGLSALEPTAAPVSVVTLESGAPTVVIRQEPISTAASAPIITPQPTVTFTPTAVEPTQPAQVAASELTMPSATSTRKPTPAPTVSLASTSQRPVVTDEPAAAGLPGLFTVTGPSGSPLSYLSVDSLSSVESAIAPSSHGRVAWSPTGQALFTADENSNREIFVLNRPGSRPVKLTAASGDDLQPAWSPDGRRIAFSSGRTGNFDIYVMEANGTNVIRLTDSRGFDEWPIWSPDGKKIAFVSDRDGNVELYVMDVDGADQRRLTNHLADDWPAAWSPDGQWLVFASKRDDDWNLYTISAAGGQPVQLTDAPGDERDPIWSPDGKAIAFAYNGGRNWDIYTLLVSFGKFTVVPLEDWTQITNTSADERYPTWQKSLISP